MLSNRRSMKCAALVAGVVIAGSACSSTVGEAKESSVDIAALDVGNYPTKPKEFGNATSLREGRIREAQRLAEFVALPYEIDPALKFPTPAASVVIDSKGYSQLARDNFDVDAKDMVTGYLAGGGTVEDNSSGYDLHNIVFLFPDEAKAAKAATDLEHSDFVVNSANQPVPIPKYPTAHAHWQPTKQSIGSWYAYKQFVIVTWVFDYGHIYANTTDLGALQATVEKSIAVMAPKLDKFVPTPADKLATLALDEDGLLGHALQSSEETKRPDSPGVYRGHGGLHLQTDAESAAAIFDDAGVDLSAFNDGGLYRTRDAAAAVKFQTESIEGLLENYDKVDAPPTLADRAQCVAPKPDAPKFGQHSGYVCIVTYGQFVGEVVARQKQDAYQKIAAQYALLASE
jgi:hypothetical protein